MHTRPDMFSGLTSASELFLVGLYVDFSMEEVEHDQWLCISNSEASTPKRASEGYVLLLVAGPSK